MASGKLVTASPFSALSNERFSMSGISRQMKQKTMLAFCLLALPIFFASPMVSAAGINFLDTYKGEPYHDSRYHAGAQPIPGKV